MKTLPLFLLIAILAVLQLGVLPQVFHGVLPDLFIVAVVVLGFTRPIKETLWLAFAGGVLLDIYSPLPMGANTLGLLIVAGLIYFLITNIFSKEANLPVMTACVAVSDIFWRLAAYGYSRLFAVWRDVSFLPLSRYFYWSLIWQVLIMCLAVYPMLYLVKRIFKMR